MKKFALVMLVGVLSCKPYQAPKTEGVKPRDLIRELASNTPEAAQADLLRLGKDAIPHLRTAMASEDRVLSRRALELMAKITGQWGSDGGIVWKRSFEEAKAESAKTGKPVLLLHIFGKLDEEFC